MRTCVENYVAGHGRGGEGLGEEEVGGWAWAGIERWKKVACMRKVAGLRGTMQARSACVGAGTNVDPVMSAYSAPTRLNKRWKRS